MARDPFDFETSIWWPAWGIRLALAIKAIIGILKQQRTEIDDNRRRLIELRADFDKFPEDLSAFEEDLGKQKVRIAANSAAIEKLRADIEALRDLDRLRIVFKVGQPVDIPIPEAPHIEFNVGLPVERPL